MLIENCHYNKIGAGQSMPKGAQPDSRGRIFPYWKDNVTGGELVCPEDTFRTSGDIRNSWGSWFGNLASLRAYQDQDHPISQPGCWAYADMLMVGVYASPYAPTAGAAASVTEWRSHFGAWAIVSSPLILSFDLTNSTTMDAVWPFITNTEVIAVNQGWAGHPGRQVFANESVQVWAKPIHAPPGASSGLRKGVATRAVAKGTLVAYAVLVVNMGRTSLDYDLDVASISPLLAPPLHARDLWEHVDLQDIKAGSSTVYVRGRSISNYLTWVVRHTAMFCMGLNI